MKPIRQSGVSVTLKQKYASNIQSSSIILGHLSKRNNDLWLIQCMGKKTLQYCKVISLQIIKINEKEKKIVIYGYQKAYTQ